MASIGRLGWLAATLVVVASAHGAEKKQDTLPVSELYLHNLFHIDKAPFYEVFRRKEGAEPLIFVGPQGNKFYYQRHPDTMAWFSSFGLDFIRMQKPVIGPWQALGQLEEHQPFKGFVFGEPTWPNAHYVGEEALLCQDVHDLAGILTPKELKRLVDARTWFTSEHYGQDDNFAFGSTAKVHLKAKGDNRYCADLRLPSLAGHYVWSLRDTAVFDAKEYSHKIEVKALPFAIETPVPGDYLSPLIYRLTLNDKNINPESVRIALTLHLGDDKSAIRILRLSQGVAELRYPQQPGATITTSGEVDFTDASGQKRQLRLPDRALMSMSTQSIQKQEQKEQQLLEKAAEKNTKSGISPWWWLFALVPVIFGTLWWWLRARKPKEALPEQSQESPETQPQAQENDDFLLDLSRPDDIDEKN
ncbi:hypothetical protein [Gallaecimonas mangrovi]|uniref:hypothetical protein n=1 Tax=Gallaecimonas mangrovi TaxID=2291597 RepID=UPI000E1FC7C6|nr:hypothetical protein [Gallaecimonas mangrovi]